MKFCGRCGAAIAATATADERRHLTVMFCDVVGSTALSERLDPEDLQDVLRAYQVACAAVVARYEGDVRQYLGDGLLVYFGYPLAHEDDARRAVLAGLEMIEAVGDLNHELERRHDLRVQVRIGIHSGLVVVGEMGHGETVLGVGETPNVAARIQGLADPDSVAVSEATRRLVDGFFEFAPAGNHTVKGISRPLPVYRVLRRVDPDASRDTTPTSLVGRDEEERLLLERWSDAVNGRGQVVLVSGEAGVGKSRLVRALRAGAESSAEWLEARCSPYHQNTVLHPVIDLLERQVSIDRTRPDDSVRRLERMLDERAMRTDDVLPFVAALLSLPLPDWYAPLNVAPPERRQRTLEAIIAYLAPPTATRPTAVVVEDLHWADPSTLDLLRELATRAVRSRLLLILTYRSELRVEWPPGEHLTEVTLGRLTAPDVRRIVDRITEGRTLPAEVLEQIIAKTDGVPLFVEELTKTVLESGYLEPQDGHYALRATLSPLAIPTTLHDSLAARLDRLASGKQVAQLVATVGREFGYELVRAVSPFDASTLHEGLDRLVSAGLLQQSGSPPAATYAFKHALIQEAAYDSLLKSRRREYHERIARALEESNRDIASAQPELLAHHYTEAALAEPAVAYWREAGRRAIERSANAEAEADLRKALELLGTLGETVDRRREELELQVALGTALVATRGYGAPEVEPVYQRALELARTVGGDVTLFRTLYGLLSFYLARGRLRPAHELGEQLLAIADAAGDEGLVLVADFSLGMCHYYRGEPEPARTRLEHGIELYDPGRHAQLRFRYVFDPGIGCRRSVALTLWLLGLPEQARRRSLEAMALAEELSHPYGLAAALYFAAVLHQYRREPTEAERRADAAIAIGREHAFAYWITCGSALRGWARAAQGDAAGVDELAEVIARSVASGMELNHPYWLALLAEAHRSAGDGEAGARAAGDALAAAERTGERCWEADVHRVRGELLLGSSRDDAERSLRRALDVARRQSALSLELRAATSLARLLRENQQDEALALLGDTYSTFTEGFETRDLEEARVLLTELRTRQV